MEKAIKITDNDECPFSNSCMSYGDYCKLKKDKDIEKCRCTDHTSAECPLNKYSKVVISFVD